MRAHILAIAGILFVNSVSYAQELRLDLNKSQQSVQNAIQWLESDMVSWKEHRHCAACHHGPMYLWSMNFAQHRGYAVNLQQLEELSRWLIESDETRIFPKPKLETEGARSSADKTTAMMMGQNNLSQPTIYMLPAVRSMNPNDPLRQLGWKKVVDHLASAQHADGAFVGRDAWRPIFNTPSLLTLQVAIGIQGVDSQLKSPAADSIVANALKYLSDFPVDESQQSQVFRILLASQPSSSPDDVKGMKTFVQRLVQLQRTDGGWAQTEDRTSDAFATGQALYALRQANLDSTHPSVVAAINFLTGSQQTDGTWQMTSRPNPEDGKPASNLNPITYAATAWATMGIASHIMGPHPAE